MDVLENGWSSPYAPYFDVDWHPRKPELEGKVLLPVLGDQYGRVLERGELQLAYEGDGHASRQLRQYFENGFPVAPPLHRRRAAAGAGGAGRRAGPRRPRPHGAGEHRHGAAPAFPRAAAPTPPDEAERAAREASSRSGGSPGCTRGPQPVRAALDAAVATFNGTPGDARSFDRLDALLDEQAYRLAFWRVAAEEINYRRFFDVNDLAGVRVETPQVFQDTHRLILRLVREGKVTGLRIDHPDGLFDPRDYLRDAAGARAWGWSAAEPFYVLVEKILTGDEPLPRGLARGGNGGIRVPQPGQRPVRRSGATRRRWTPSTAPSPASRTRFEDLVYEKKRLILRSALVSELTVLTTCWTASASATAARATSPGAALRDALREVVACFPVYRTYVDAVRGAGGRARPGVRGPGRASRAKRRNRGTSGAIFDFVRNTLLLHWPDELDEEARREHARLRDEVPAAHRAGDGQGRGGHGVLRLQPPGLAQRGGRRAGPLRPHAGGVPRWPCWTGRSAGRTPCPPAARTTPSAARTCAPASTSCPRSRSCGRSGWRRGPASTPPQARWRTATPIPDPNDEYLLYQTLVGAWPFGELDDQGRQDFTGAAAGVHGKGHARGQDAHQLDQPQPGVRRGIGRRSWPTSWLTASSFLEDFLPFQRIVARLGMVNALAQTLVKLTAPGVPDVYQGQEAWDFSLVDPDNRRPVDYGLRRRLLDGLAARRGEVDGATLARELVEGWEDGRIKMHVVQQALRLRAALPTVFGRGAYLPLVPEGARAGARGRLRPHGRRRGDHHRRPAPGRRPHARARLRPAAGGVTGRARASPCRTSLPAATATCSRARRCAPARTGWMRGSSSPPSPWPCWSASVDYRDPHAGGRDAEGGPGRGRQGRMNSRQRPHEVRLRGLSGTGECHATGEGFSPLPRSLRERGRG